MTSNNIEKILFEMQRIRERDDDIVIDCSNLVFIDPCGLTVLASGLDKPAEQGRKITLDFLPLSITSYLQRMNFFEHFDAIEGVDLRPQQRKDKLGYLCELTRISSEALAEDAVETLAWAVTGTFNEAESNTSDDLALFHPIKYALSELVGNSVTHAKRDGNHAAAVWVAAQYYQATGSVKVSVTDNGCGFLATLRNHPSLHGETTHSAAIRAALIPRVSCNRGIIPYGTSENQGVGLTTTAKLSRKADGSMTIFSGNGLYRDPSARRSSRVRTITPHWQGVGVVLDVNRDNLTTVKIHELLPEEEAALEGGEVSQSLNFV